MSAARRRVKPTGPSRQQSIIAADVRGSGEPRHTWLLLGLLFCVAMIVVAVHWPAMHADVQTFDDQQYLIDNWLVQDPGFRSAWTFLTEVTHPSTVKGYYQPITMISLMLDYAAGGRAEYRLSFHRTSVLLHACNTTLVALLLWQLFRHPWIAAAVALVFGLHPLTVEPIPWLGERGTLLAAAFSLISLICYVRYTRARPRWPWFTACGLAYLLALMSKPTSVMLPLGMLAMDYWPLRRLRWQSIIEKLPLLALAAASAAITMISKVKVGSGFTLPQDQPAWRGLLVLCHNIVFYLQKIIWPAGLAPNYAPPEPLTLSHPAVLVGVIGTVLLIVLAMVSLRWTRAFCAGLLFWSSVILPTMGVIGFSFVLTSDKYTYLPAVGLLFILAWLIGLALDKGTAAPGKRRVAIGLMLVGVFAGETIMTRSQLGRWKDNLTFYRWMVERAPGAARAHCGLGNAFVLAKRYEEALAPYHRAIELDPKYAEAWYDLANALCELNRIEEGIAAYRQSIQLNPGYVPARINLALTLAGQERYTEAVEQYQLGIRLSPTVPRFHYLYAQCLMQAGRPDRAMTEYREVLRLQPDLANAAALYNELGIACAQAGQTQEAIAAYRQAMAFEPAEALYPFNLANVLAASRRLAEAIPYYEQAIRLRPGFAQAIANRETAIAELQRSQQTVPLPAGR